MAALRSPLRDRKTAGHPASAQYSSRRGGSLADFVVFTDDDVEPAPGWLAELLRVQALYRADVVAGPNPPRFLDEPPTWVVEGHFFDGQQRSTGDLVDTAATHNVLVRSKVFQQMDYLFDERFALHGCTDTEFFRRVAREGYRMVWAQDAPAYECISASRMTLGWLLQRAYRIANGLGSSELRHLRGHTALWVFVNGLKCLARGAVHLVRAVALRQGAAARVHALLRLASGAGWLTGLFGLRYREYARVYGK
jgi:succinoglycan biosynthesis protein ExoM